MTTRGMTGDVLIALTPALAAVLFYFRWLALKQLVICMMACVAAEALFMRMCSWPLDLTDLSALVTGAILGLSLPATAPWYGGLIAAIVIMAGIREELYIS